MNIHVEDCEAKFLNRENIEMFVILRFFRSLRETFVFAKIRKSVPSRYMSDIL
jgi:hypothetical protein